MKEKILNQLKDIEQQYNVDILFAMESGSRAWGFASPDSDYDIRFVYKAELENYLSLWNKKDTIEFMTEDDLDGSGWDLKKACTLLAKSNASLLGWLFSPVIYIEQGDTLSKMKQLAQDNFNPVAGFHHYHSMNKGFYEQLQEGNIRLKAFFYAARTALCANWVIKKLTIPPVDFTELYELIDAKSIDLFNELIERKANVLESGSISIPSHLVGLMQSIVEENNSRKGELTSKKADYEAFNSFFIKEVQ